MRGRLYTYRYTVTTRMTSALRWAAMRAILMFHFNVCEGQSHKKVSIDRTFKMKGEPKQIRTEVPLLTSLGQTGSLTEDVPLVEISVPFTYSHAR